MLRCAITDASPLNQEDVDFLVAEKVCAVCKETKRKAEFLEKQWSLTNCSRIKCKECQQKQNQRKVCSICNEALQQSQFSISQWKNAGSTRRCKTCLKEKIRLERSDICYVCNQRKTKSQFSQSQWRYCDKNARTCHKCMNKRKGTDNCSVCKRRKEKPAQWQLRDEARKSNKCSQLRVCSICNEALQKSQFGIHQWQNPRGGRKCINCLKEKKRLERSDICSVCKQRKEKSKFSQDQWRYWDENTRTCHQCLNERMGTDICSVCKKKKWKKHFSEHQWNTHADTERTCRKCQGLVL